MKPTFFVTLKNSNRLIIKEAIQSTAIFIVLRFLCKEERGTCYDRNSSLNSDMYGWGKNMFEQIWENSIEPPPPAEKNQN